MLKKHWFYKVFGVLEGQNVEKHVFYKVFWESGSSSGQLISAWFLVMQNSFCSRTIILLQTAGSKKQAADGSWCWQEEAAGNRRQAAGSRQQARSSFAPSRTHDASKVGG